MPSLALIVEIEAVRYNYCLSAFQDIVVCNDFIKGMIARAASKIFEACKIIVEALFFYPNIFRASLLYIYSSGRRCMNFVN